MKILEILNSSRIRTLEDVIVGYMERGGYSNVVDELGIVERRKRLIDKALLAHCADELREDILHFDELLKKEVEKMEKMCKETWYDIVGDDVFLGEKDLYVCGKISMGSNYSTLHPLQDDDRQTLWDLLVDESFRQNHACVRTKAMIWNFDRQEKREGREPTFFYDKDADVFFDNEFLDSLHLSVGFAELYKKSYLALTDFIYIRTFETAIHIIEEPHIGSGSAYHYDETQKRWKRTFPESRGTQLFY